MVKVLDHGYLKLIDTMGSDERIIESARMSTDKGFLGWGPVDCSCVGIVDCDGMSAKDWELDCPKCKGTGGVSGDEKLLRYLYVNRHSGPFEFCTMTVEIKAPIFVIREWVRSRTQGYNEMSARYIPIPDEHYIPSLERCMMGGGSNKQAGGTGATLSEVDADCWRTNLIISNRIAQKTYEESLAMGISKELARLSMPVNRYSKMRASANLRNWLGFMTLRCDSSAQWEIRQYANEVAKLVEEHFPRTYELWCK